MMLINATAYGNDHQEMYHNIGKQLKLSLDQASK